MSTLLPGIVEIVGSRDSDTALAIQEGRYTLRFVVGGYDDDTAADAYIQNNLPAYYRGLRFNNYTKAGQGNGIWLVEANYGMGRLPSGLIQFSFDTTGEKTKVLQSYSSTYYPAPGQAQVDYKGAIEVKKTGGTIKTEGVEITIPTFSFTLTRQFDETAVLDGPTLDLLMNSTGLVNNDTIAVQMVAGLPLNFKPGELLFLGATGGQKSQGQITVNDTPAWEGEIVLKFAYSQNLTNATIAGIAGISKQGWDYLWVAYQEDDSGTVLIPKPIQVNVEQVYQRSALAPLFFGGN